MFVIRTAALIAATILLTSSSLCAATTSYHIGNSLTWDSQPWRLSNFAESQGLEHDVGYHVLGGNPLHAIVANPNSLSVLYSQVYGRHNVALPNFAWTAVTMQPHPGPNSTLAADVDAMLQLIDLTRSNPANAETTFYVYAAWPQLTGPNETQWDAAQWNREVVDSLSTATIHARSYYEHLINRVRTETDAEVLMIPVGDVLNELDSIIQQNGIPGFSNLSPFYRDVRHLSVDYGRYTASATTFASIFGSDPRNLTSETWPAEMSAEAFSAINEAIHRVLDANPYTRVDVSNPPRADFDGNGIVDELDLAMWQAAEGKTAVSDANGDDMVDGGDFLAWQRRVGDTVRRTDNFELEDVNRDGLVDDGDLFIWQNAFGEDAGYDIDADGVTDGADFLLWQRAVTPTLPEDFDRDSTVNAGDVALWEENFGFNLAADANGDGVIDGVDYLFWEKEEGRVWPPPEGLAASAAVPEPSSLGVVAGLFLAASGGRYLRRKAI
jgi:hypothetical protein